MNELMMVLKNKEMTLSCAESLTGGLFGSTITSFSGASKVFKGGVICYDNDVKEKVLNVDKEIIDTYGVVSSACASMMARGVKKLLNTDVAISFTGNAGPDVMEGKPVGLVYIGICIGETSFSFEYTFSGDRNSIRNQCVKEGIKKILELI